MYKVSKFSSNKFLILLALIMIISLFYSISIFNLNNIAYADDSIEIVYPTASYYQVLEPNCITSNDKYIVLFDKSNSSINIYDKQFNKIKFFNVNFQDTSDISLYLADDLLIVQNGSIFYKLNIISDNFYQQIADPILKNITTDGNKVYQRLPSGSIYTYDSNLNLEYNNNCDEFTGKDILMTCYNSIYYIFKHNFKQNKTEFIKFDSTKDDINLISEENYTILNKTINSVKYINNGFICESDNHLFYIKEDLTETIQFYFNYDFYFPYNDRLYVLLNNTLNIYYIDFDNATYNLIDSLSNTGSNINYLNSPTDVIKTNNSLIIADSNNKRVVISNNLEVKQIDLDYKPLKICGNEECLYILDDQNIINKYENNTILKYDNLSDIIDILYIDKLYILTSNGVYSILGNDFIKIFNIDNAKSITTSNNANVIYILTNNTIITITLEGQTIPFDIKTTYDFSKILDIQVDKIGNIILADTNKIYIYTNNTFELNCKEEIEIKSTNYNLTINSIYLFDKELYLSTNESLIIKKELDVISNTNEIQNNDYSISDTTKFNYAKFINNESTYYLPTNFNLNKAVKTDNQEFILLDINENINNYKYAIINEQLVLVNPANIEIVSIENTSNDITGFYIDSNINIYYIPSLISQQSLSSQKVIITPLSQSFSINGHQWTKIIYEDKEVYILTTDLKHLDTEDNNIELKTAKVKAKSIGKTVSLYSNDLFNEEIAKISDGKEINIINEFDNYYYVSYENTFGYIYKSDVQLDGLTHLQILAIILACIVIILSTTIYVLIYFTKHKEEK